MRILYKYKYDSIVISLSGRSFMQLLTKKVQIVNVNRFGNQFFLMSALSKDIFWSLMKGC